MGKLLSNFINKQADILVLKLSVIFIFVFPLRYLPFLSPEGYIVTNTNPFRNVTSYPDYDTVIEELKRQPRMVALDAEALAREAGNLKASNMVMLGAATPFIDIPLESIERGIREIFSRKGDEVVALNLKALHIGRSFAEAHR